METGTIFQIYYVEYMMKKWKKLINYILEYFRYSEKYVNFLLSYCNFKQIHKRSKSHPTL